MLEPATELAVLVLAAWPVLRLVATPAFHRRLAAHPGRLAIVGGGITGYLVVLVLLATGPAVLLRACAVLALGVVLVAWWRARPSYGRSRGLPPGSLAAMQLGPITDERFLLEQARQHGPVFKIARFGRPIVCVVGLARGAELLRTAGDDLTSGPLPFSGLIPGGFLRYMAPEDHARYRALLARALPNDLVRASAPTVAAAAQRAFARMAVASRAAPGVGVAPGPFLRRITYEAMISLVFGLPADDPRSARMLALYPRIESATLARIDGRRVRAAMADLLAIVREAAGESTRRVDGGQGSCCSLDLLARHDRAALSDPTLLGNLVYLVETGGRDVADLLTWALKMLVDHPAWLARLEAEACAGKARGELGVAARIIAETLRLEQSEYIVRTARRPLSVGGYRIPAGWLVRLCVRESHRDPTIFAAPDRFDPDRHVGAPFDANAYAPLGMGRHTCLGRTLVQVAGAAVLETLARGFAWTATADGPREFGTFHWMPSSRLRLAVAERAG
jgi:cytochrome P450